MASDLLGVGDGASTRVDRAAGLRVSRRGSDRVGPRRDMGRIDLSHRRQSIHRVFLLLQGSRPGRDCENEPSAVALALPGNLRRTLDSGRSNRGIGDGWDGGNYGDRGWEPVQAELRKVSVPEEV